MFGWLAKVRDPRRELEALLGDYELPSFPEAVLRALSKLRDASAEPDAVARAIAVDPGLSVRVLSVVNSPAYSLRHAVKNLDHAIKLLGRSQVEALLISAGVSQTMPKRAIGGYQPKSFWRAAAERASIAQSLAARLHPRTKSESFTAALLADMAVPLIAKAKGGVYAAILATYLEETSDLVDLEREAFGFDHAEVGARLCESWEFPDLLRTAVGAHHDSTSDLGLPAVNAVAHLRCTQNEDDLERLIEHVRPLGIAADETLSLIARGHAEAAGIAACFG